MEAMEIDSGRHFDPKLAGLIGFVLGTIFGLVVLGWQLFPVEWKDAAPADLHPAYRKIYVRLVALDYERHRNIAVARYQLGTEDPVVLQKILSEALDEASPEETIAVSALSAALGVSVSAPAEGTPGVGPATPTVEAPSGGGGGLALEGFLPICGVGAAVLLAIAAVAIVIAIRRRRSEEGEGEYARGETGPPEWLTRLREEEEAAGVIQPEAPPLGHFVTTYALGNDNYDESFSIESPVGEFLGECGVGISETIGMGDPDKVTAFEVWLFDKNDVRTETVVLMSEYAYNDQALRTRLAAKGEPVLAEVGKPITLETASLRLDAMVTEMEYGTGALPENSFFKTLTVELVTRMKGEEAEGMDIEF